MTLLCSAVATSMLARAIEARAAIGTASALSSSIASVAAKATCGICLTAAGDVELWCSHTFCATCLNSADNHGHRSCPVCRVPHLLSTNALRRNVMQLRESYQSWRRGLAVGSTGEVEDVSGYPGWRMGVLHPSVQQTLHRASCGLLFKFDQLRTDPSTALCSGQPIKPPSDESKIFMEGRAHSRASDLNENTLGRDSKVASQENDAYRIDLDRTPRKQKRNILFITADQVSLTGPCMRRSAFSMAWPP